MQWARASFWSSGTERGYMISEPAGEQERTIIRIQASQGTSDSYWTEWKKAWNQWNEFSISFFSFTPYSHFTAYSPNSRTASSALPWFPQNSCISKRNVTNTQPKKSLLFSCTNLTPHSCRKHQMLRITYAFITITITHTSQEQKCTHQKQQSGGGKHVTICACFTNQKHQTYK